MISRGLHTSRVIFMSFNIPARPLHPSGGLPWAYYKIRKLAGYACAGNVSLAPDFEENR